MTDIIARLVLTSVKEAVAGVKAGAGAVAEAGAGAGDVSVMIGL